MWAESLDFCALFMDFFYKMTHIESAYLILGQVGAWGWVIFLFFLVSSDDDGDERSDVGNVDYIVVVDVAMFYGIAC